MKKTIVTALATGLYSGYFPIVAGTVGTIPAWLIAYFLIGGDTLTLAITAVITTAISVWAAGEAEEIFGHDSKSIVSDEWAGMFITLLFVPFSLTNYLLGFVLFRIFDVIKLWPASAAEKLPRGWGVTMDDVVAGIQANLVLHGVIWLIQYFG
jgi:phosphatidylglycerophosphatase A